MTPHNQEFAVAELNVGVDTSANDCGVPPAIALSASFAASAHFCINRLARARKPYTTASSNWSLFAPLSKPANNSAA